MKHKRRLICGCADRKTRQHIFISSMRQPKIQEQEQEQVFIFKTII